MAKRLPGVPAERMTDAMDATYPTATVLTGDLGAVKAIQIQKRTDQLEALLLVDGTIHPQGSLQ